MHRTRGRRRRTPAESLSVLLLFAIGHASATVATVITVVMLVTLVITLLTLVTLVTLVTG